MKVMRIPSEKIILHCDCDGFFASVECLHHPELKSVPMAVSGNPHNRHGIILAKNQLAKDLGIKTAETIWQAKKKCPELILVRPHYDKYVECCKKINAIYQEYTDLAEKFGIDESFLDMTGSLHLFGLGEREFADLLRKRVREEVGVTISVGVSFTRVFAKLGSDFNKPDGTTVITKQNYKQLLYPLSLGEIMGAGPKITAKLEKCGIMTIGQLAACAREGITEMLGKHGTYLWDAVQGRGETEVKPTDYKEMAKSVGNGRTFSRNLIGKADTHAGIAMMVDKVVERLSDKKLLCSGVQISIRTPEFENTNRQMQLACPTQAFGDLFEAACALLEAHWDFTQPVRNITVTGIGIQSEAEVLCQPTLFVQENKNHEKRKNLQEAVHKLRAKYGPGSVYPAVIKSTSLFEEEESKKGTSDVWDISGYVPFHGIEG